MINEIKKEVKIEYRISIPTTKATIDYSTINGSIYKIHFNNNDLSNEDSKQSFVIEDYQHKYMDSFIDLMSILIESIKNKHN